NGYSQKGQKRSKNDKTEYVMEEREKPKSKSKSTPTKSKVKTEADIEEMLNGPTRTHLMGRIPIYYDDDDDEESYIPLRDIIISKLPPCIAITPVLLTEEPVDSLIIEDEHLDTIPATKSDKVIKSSIEELDFSPISNDDSTLIDDDSFSIDNIDYVEASPPHSELVSLKEVKDFHPEDGELEDDYYEAFFCDSEPDSGDFTMDSFVIKSSIPVEDGDSFLEKFETAPELETFKFDIEEKNSGRSTIHADISLPDLECFYFKNEPDL
ncbi:hypothetical protein Tco_1227127, partial [Tanacetum coccineum]